VFETLKSLDQQLFLFLNGKHNAFFDFIMFWASDRFIWIPFYAFLFFLVIKSFGKKTWIILLLIALMITMSDQVSSGLVKNAVHRLRPCHTPGIEEKVHLVNGVCGGSFGYFSSHASNTWALALFLIFIFRRKLNKGNHSEKKVIGIYPLTPILITYASVVSYSRIYLGTHYPFDVFTGVVFGTLLSFIFAQLFFRFAGKPI